MRWLVLVIVGLFGAILLYAEGALPIYGDPQAPASVHVSPDYLERSYADTRTPNVVTAILADYRGYDTFGETTVIFAAGIACSLLLRKGANGKQI